MWRAIRPLAPWAVGLMASLACAVLIINSWTTVHTRADMRALSDLAVAAAVAVTLVAAVTRHASPGAAGLAFAIAVVGATRADDGRVAIAGFALAAGVPLVALGIAHRRGRWPMVAVAIASATTVFARLVWRDPFRELRCEPFCDANPFLIGRHPGLVRGAELLLVVATAIAVVDLAARRGFRSLADAAALAVAALYALRLTWRPRPVPDTPGDIAADLVLLVGLLVIVAARSAGIWSVVAERRAMRAFGRALAAAHDVAAIEASLRRSTRDGNLIVHLGSESRDTGSEESRTAVVRNGRTVATVVHRPDVRDRVAQAVTPSVALVLETQLLLDQARRRVAEVDAARALAARSTDDARRTLERNLHDGAQQHLLVTGMTLAAAADEAADADAVRYRTAADDVATALAELRRIGRGDAATIAELGLADAAISLAGSSLLPLTTSVSGCGTEGHECWPLESASAAYRLLVSTLAEAEQSTAGGFEFEAQCLGPGLGRRVSCRHDGQPADRPRAHDPR